MGLDAERTLDATKRVLVRLRERVAAVLRQVPARSRERARDENDSSDGAECERLVHTPVDGYAETRPDRRQAEARENQRQRDEQDIEPHETMLELGHHCGRR